MSRKIVTQLDEARMKHSEAIETMEEFDGKCQTLPEEAGEDEVKFYREGFDRAKAEAARWADQIERLDAIAEARRAIRIESDQNEDKDEGREVRPATARGVNQEPTTYSENSASRGVSFFVDLVNATRGDMEARTRLERHTSEVAYERRDISTTATAGGNFVPPQYLGELYAELPRPGRPFADAVPSRPLMATGMNITIPRITTGTAVAELAVENTSTVSETDIVEALLTVPVRTIAGQQDVSQQLFDRSEPGIDQIIFSDLRRAYDAKLDSQLLNGAGTTGTHLGIRAVTAPNTVTFTSASPTAALAVPAVYNAIQLVESNQFTQADMIVMHPRRSAWLASNLSSTFPLFQLGSLTQASGTQDVGMATSIGGLRVIRDANVRSTDGASTNQDEIYVLDSSSLILYEGPLQARVLPEIGSNTLTVRLQLFAYSAFVSGRCPKAISIISGTGLTAPTF
jgi:HK97 family phage major capsid protein